MTSLGFAYIYLQQKRGQLELEVRCRNLGRKLTCRPSAYLLLLFHSAVKF
jgi:hypothetical protein